VTRISGNPGCGGDCRACPTAKAVRADAGGLEGGRLVLASLGLFLFPLLCALAGAAWAGRGKEEGAGGLLGALAGFFGAVFLAKAVLLVRGRRLGR